MLRVVFVRSQKRTPKPKNRTNGAKEFSEQFEGLTGHDPLKQGFSGRSHQKVHPNVRRNLCRKSSLGYLFCPWFCKGARVFFGVCGGGVWGQVQVAGGEVTCLWEMREKGGRGGGVGTGKGTGKSMRTRNKLPFSKLPFGFSLAFPELP